MTARDLINGSARLLGILGSGEVLQASEASDALSALNDMLSVWSVENLLIYGKTEEEFPLVAGQQSYTMGVGGNFNTTRPQRIENASVRIVNGSTTYDLPIEIFNQDQWSSIAIKSVNSNIPTKLFAQGTYPLETILLWPIPAAVKTLVLWTWKPFSSFATLDSVVSFPPAYAKAIRYNLALELGPEYGKEPSGLVIAEASEAKGAIKRMNQKPSYMSTDPALISQSPTFNWLTGE